MTADTVQEHRGRVVKSTGDGIVATFDGPARGVHTLKGISDPWQIYAVPR
ncbi:MAG TPA: hypothetical protein VI916_14650 [Acidimicrobiia bacterium]|nr:hypothetical protein [Acidimicrobiia bacterium]